MRKNGPYTSRRKKLRPTARPRCLVDRALYRFAAEHAVPTRHIKQSTRSGTGKEGYRPHTSSESHRYPSEGVTVAVTTEGVSLSAWRPRSNFVVTIPKGVTLSKHPNLTSTLYDFPTLINIVYVLTVIVITNNPTVSHKYIFWKTIHSTHTRARIFVCARVRV
jgi:hypothetical protein